MPSQEAVDRLIRRREIYSDALSAHMREEFGKVQAGAEMSYELAGTFIYIAQELVREAGIAVSTLSHMGLVTSEQIRLLMLSLPTILAQAVAKNDEYLRRGIGACEPTPKHDKPVAGMSIDDMLKGGGQ